MLAFTIRLLCLLGLLGFVAGPTAGGDADKRIDTKLKEPKGEATGPVEVRFNDESRLKLIVLEPQIELITRYGKLLVPWSDIQRMELGRRSSPETLRRVQTAITALGSTVFRERDAAGAELLGLREKAYPALLEALNHADPEVVRRTEAILTKLRETVADDVLEAPGHDVIHTLDARLTGQITIPSLRVRTTQFGELQMKLADVRSLRMAGAPDFDGDTKNALADPGSLSNYTQQPGKTFQFQVTGSAQGSLYGTDTYTTDSTLAKAAVHAGVLKQGQAGVVRVTILPAQANFVGSTRNGVTSTEWGQYPAAFQFKRR